MDTKMRNKIKGAIYGFAIGDAMGATTEFMTREEIKEKYGEVHDLIGGGWMNLNPGEVTDDTQMSICIMETLMEIGEHDLKRGNILDVTYRFAKGTMDRFVEWYKSGPKDIGNQCASAIIDYMRKEEFAWFNDQALGNGGLMRFMPCAVLDLKQLNVIQSSLTHNNHEAARSIRMIQDYFSDYMMDKSIIPGKDPQKPSGFIWNTFNNSVFWSCQETFYDCIVEAVNDGGDADTIAAITGALAGARFGFDEIPEKWVEDLNSSTKIILDKFINFAFSYVQV